MEKTFFPPSGKNLPTLIDITDRVKNKVNSIGGDFIDTETITTSATTVKNIQK